MHHMAEKNKGRKVNLISYDDLLNNLREFLLWNHLEVEEALSWPATANGHKSSAPRL